MKGEIINCYELDLKQDIPTEMELLILSNDELKTSNKYYKIAVLLISVGVLFSIIYNSKIKHQKKKEY